MGDALTNAIDADEITSKEDSKLRGRKLADTYGWDVTEARKIWCFGPDTTGPNVLVDKS